MERIAGVIAHVWDDAVPRPAWQQMAIDRVLADGAATTGIIVYRIYRWQTGSVSFGANESARRTWDRERLERLQLPCVRRPTGGRGVWHDPADLTYAVTAPVSAFGTLRLAYRSIHERLAVALRTLGLDAELAVAARRPTLEPGSCFDLAIGGEVMAAGRKTIGSAQALVGPALLQHGAIALADRASSLARFRLGTQGEPPPSPTGELAAASRVADGLVTAWRDAGAVPLSDAKIDSAIRDSNRYATHFLDPDWTWRR